MSAHVLPIPSFPAPFRVLPGLCLSILVAVAAWAGARGEAAWADGVWLEPLVLAILLGAAVRAVYAPGPAVSAGIRFAAHTVLEIAVMLLGVSVSFATIVGSGAALLGGIVAAVALSLGASFAIGRALGLPPRMATLVACGNSICGNSAIAAVAPVIGADAQEISTSIAFTAVLGIGVVLALPALAGLLHLAPRQAGALAGLTVYAVPQVLAAAAPMGLLAVQVGTLVKLVRVLMLGPVVLGLSLWMDRHGAGTGHSRGGLGRLVPWFIVGFLALAAARSVGVVPPVLVAPVAMVTSVMTVVSMAALGLGTDVRAVAGAGLRVSLTVTLSWVVLGIIALGVVSWAV